MPVGLLPIIYLAFISLGLPDAALGSAWPLMAPALGAGISWVGAVTMIISAGTIASSLMSVRVVERFGTGRVTAASVLLTAAGLAGFGSADEKLDAAGRPDGRSACTTGIPWGWRCWRSRRA